MRLHSRVAGFISSIAAGFLWLWATAGADASGVALVANYGDDSVSMIALSSNSVIATIPVGLAPQQIAISPDARRAYAANSGDATISVIDTVQRVVVDTISVGSTPYDVVVSEDGLRAYVSNTGAASISVIDTFSNAVVDTIATADKPSALALHPTRNEIWVGFEPAVTTGSTALAAYDLDSGNLLGSIVNQGDTLPLHRLYGQDLKFLADGSELFASEACGHCGRFHRISGTISPPLPGEITLLEPDILYDNTGAARGVGINPVDGTVYMAKIGQVTPFPHRLVEFGGSERTLALEAPPHGIAVSKSGQLIYVTHDVSSGFVTVIDAVTFANIDSIDVGSHPRGIAVSSLADPVALPGDYNDDGTVDAADYTVWRDNLGNGQFTEDHFDEWRQNFGASSPGLAAGSDAALPGAGSRSAPVPELGTWMLAVIGLFVLSAVPRPGPGGRF